MSENRYRAVLTARRSPRPTDHLAGHLGVVAGQPVLGAHEDADHAFGGAGGAVDVGVGAFGTEVAAGDGPALLDGDGVLDRGGRAFGCGVPVRELRALH